MKQKLIQVTRTIFAYGMAVLMVVTFLVALCYLSAFIVGLPMSEMICGFLNTYILPYVGCVQYVSLQNSCISVGYLLKKGSRPALSCGILIINFNGGYLYE